MDKKHYEERKDFIKGLALAYTLIGSLSMLGWGTGHPSADLYMGESEPTSLEKICYCPIFEKLGIDTKLADECGVK